MNTSAQATLEERAAGIRLAVFDVDGVLTDGRIILGPDGDEYKAFHVRDGHGLVRLRESGVLIAVITGRRSAALERRMQELGVDHVHQGIRDKRTCLLELLGRLGLTATQTCYVGDDLPDLPALQMVGLPVAVADACPEVIDAAAWVTGVGGGHGAAREVCDRLLKAQSATAGP
ncbi:MAG: HAD-IIIA family hydrolase [Gammaproteobacteria bacterium]